jgi:hypothetical protein
MHPRIVALRAEGLTWREIGERVGLALSTVADYGTDPDGSRARARKAKQAGGCADCGASTSYGTGRPSERCMPCHGAHTREQSRRWILDSFKEWNDLFGVPPTSPDWNPALARAKGMDHKAQRHAQTGRPWPTASLVQDIFGSWNAGRAAAGFDTFTPGRYGRDGEDPAVVAQTVTLYRSGLCLREVGERMGVHAQTVRQRLIAAGEPRRPARRPKATERKAS